MSAVREELGSLVNTGCLGSRDIIGLRNEISQSVIHESPNIDVINFNRMAASDLRFLMKRYDQLFFNDLCQKAIVENNDSISFRVSNRMTSAGGKTTVESIANGRKSKTRRKRFPCRKFEIAMSAVLLFGTQFDSETANVDGRVSVAGVACSHRLDALLRIFEHELVHLIEFLIWNDSSCGKRQFKSIAKRFFGHQQSNHQLITPSESAEQFQGIGVGDFVGFQHAGHRYMGYVNHIHRRATVLVPDKKGTRYADGKCYAKYYVPLGRLQRIGA